MCHTNSNLMRSFVANPPPPPNFEDRCIPNLPSGVVIAVDNALYHNHRAPESVCPTSNSRNTDLIAWLTGKSIRFDKTVFKAQSYQLIKLHKPKSVHVVDELAKIQGCVVLTSPDGHCELNPELIWVEVKGKVARRNTTQHMKDVHALMSESQR